MPVVGTTAQLHGRGGAGHIGKDTGLVMSIIGMPVDTVVVVAVEDGVHANVKGYIVVPNKTGCLGCFDYDFGKVGEFRELSMGFHADGMVVISIVVVVVLEFLPFDGTVMRGGASFFSMTIILAMLVIIVMVG